MRHYVNFTTILGLIIVTVHQFKVASADDIAPLMAEPPSFRGAPAPERPEFPVNAKVRLIADQSFPPFSFVSNTGAPAGLAVELAVAACERAQLDCTVEAKPFDEILPTLLTGKADAAVTGPQPDQESLRQLTATRPYFRIMGRFAAATGQAFGSATPAALAGARIGVARDTLHSRWLETYYSSAEIVPLDNLAAAGDALRKGEVDALFGDNLQVIYWLSGEAAAGCCAVLDSAFSDFDYYARDLVFLVRRSQPELRDALDYGLDQAQASGATARILNAYVPLPLW